MFIAIIRDFLAGYKACFRRKPWRAKANLSRGRVVRQEIGSSGLVVADW